MRISDWSSDVCSSDLIRPGEIIQVAEWMLDRALCADMEMGEPRVAVIGLVELHGLLTDRGFRQTSTDGLTAIQEARNEGTTTTRSEERRVGKEWDSAWRSRRSP